MIKLFKSLLVPLFVLIGLEGCVNGTNEDPKPELKEITLAVGTTEFNYSAAGGNQELSITSNAIWNFEYDKSGWSRPSIQTSTGNATIKIVADENPDKSPRSTELTLKSDGANDVIITVNQEGKANDPTENPDYIDPDNTGMRDHTSQQLAEEMGLGWNLGNSLEAILENNGNLSGSETSWGNPVVTKELMDAVKAAGFNTIRIPVSWSHKLEDEETFEISEEWLQRVEEVATYALDNDMYAMINIHWDGGWMNHPDYENQEAINTKLAAMWKQIAVYFRDYDDHLLFAGTNEVHVDGDFGAPTAENAEVQNSFNQTFVDAVRATGGRNTYRHLIVQSYNTNIEHGVNYLTIPDDDTEDRLMVEVHFYDPYQFALVEQDGKALWGEEHQGSAAHSGWGDEAWVDEAFGQVKSKFVDEGYPVILGEYGALLRTSPTGVSYEDHVASRNYYLNYVTAAALANGIVPVYWDNGHTGNYGFGLFNRSTGAVVHQGAVDAITDALGE